MRNLRVLVLGASGMLGNAVLRVFAENFDIETYGTVHLIRSANFLPPAVRPHLMAGVDVENVDSLLAAFGKVQPDAVINCIGPMKQLSEADDPLTAILSTSA